MIKKAESGDDEQAFIASLYDEYKYLMYATVKKYLTDSESIQDILQDCLLKLLSKVKILKSLEKPALVTYIVYTVRNTTFNFLRHQSAENRYLTFEFDYEQFETSESEVDTRNVENQVLTHSESEEFRKLLLKLPDRDQELLIRRYYLNQSDQEIAAQLNCKASSVRMMLTRARRTVLDQIRKERLYEENR